MPTAQAPIDSMTTIPTREFQMVRIRAGLYLLPSNDEQWIFQLRRRDILDGDRWGSAWYCEARPFEAFRYAIIHAGLRGDDPYDLIDDDNWTHICIVDTRREAIDEAMAWGEARRHED